MRVVVYPADAYGCGYHRLIWPAEQLRAAGHDVEIVMPKQRDLRLLVDQEDRVRDVEVDDGVDVVVMQRTTHRYLSQAVGVMRTKGVAVVVDVDDDLASVHPANPAWRDLHPHRERYVRSATPHPHSWHNLQVACRDATLVTATTDALLRRYAQPGRGALLPNYLAEHYYRQKRTDSTLVGWPAALTSHPNDPSALGPAVARLVADGVEFAVPTASDEVARAFGLASVDQVTRIDEAIELLDWPRYLAGLGVGIAPLADTRFNEAKSWLKPLELAAVGVPWVASPRADYRRLYKLGCGVLVEKPKDWYRVLKRLVTDRDYRAELSERGRDVADTLRLRDHAWRWWTAWEDARAIQLGANDVAPARVG